MSYSLKIENSSSQTFFSMRNDGVVSYGMSVYRRNIRMVKIGNIYDFMIDGL